MNEEDRKNYEHWLYFFLKFLLVFWQSDSVYWLLEEGQYNWPSDYPFFLTLPCNASYLGFTRHNSHWREDLTEDSVGLHWQT